MKILHVVGARPNFMKAAPVWGAIAKKSSFQQILLHTGQHYDINMSEVFFNDLNLPKPDHYLGVGSGTHGVQTASVMLAFETVATEVRPDLVLVYGDVNSTLAAALVCAKLMIPVAHVEAGLRSFDRHMPEEINRLLTDQIADLLFTPSADGDQNLKREGIDPRKIHRVGNVMIDTVVSLLPKAEERGGNVPQDKYGVLTLHRPSNVDDAGQLKSIVKAVSEISEYLRILFPVHPRTKRHIADLDLELPERSRLRFLDPMGYVDFIGLERNATVIITDSGGIQEETTYLGVPCLTLRENTERPVTVTEGTNLLVGRDMDLLKEEVGRILSGRAKRGRVPSLWDGHASERIADILGIVAGDGGSA